MCSKALPWHRLRFQVSQLKKAISTRCDDNDVVIISELDEILRASDLLKIKDYVEGHPQALAYCGMSMYRFYLNMRATDVSGENEPWFGPVIGNWQAVKKYDWDTLRRARWSAKRIARYNGVVFNDSGWHFTGMGGLEARAIKEKSCAEVDKVRQGKFVQKDLDDLLSECKLEEIDASFPEDVVNNLQSYIDRGYIYSS